MSNLLGKMSDIARNEDKSIKNWKLVIERVPTKFR
jgi:hypothetical protein